MIKIKVNNKIIEISGHADYEACGKDIVCASVSSIVYTTINGILNIDNTAIKFSDNDSLKIEILKNDDITTKLISSMLELLKDLEKQYPENIKISKGE